LLESQNCDLYYGIPSKQILLMTCSGGNGDVFNIVMIVFILLNMFVNLS